MLAMWPVSQLPVLLLPKHKGDRGGDLVCYHQLGCLPFPATILSRDKIDAYILSEGCDLPRMASVAVCLFEQTDSSQQHSLKGSYICLGAKCITLLGMH